MLGGSGPCLVSHHDAIRIDRLAAFPVPLPGTDSTEKTMPGENPHGLSRPRINDSDREVLEIIRVEGKQPRDAIHLHGQDHSPSIRV